MSRVDSRSTPSGLPYHDENWTSPRSGFAKWYFESLNYRACPTITTTRTVDVGEVTSPTPPIRQRMRRLQW
jgi:hypothetical protein